MEPIRIGVYICWCGSNIAKMVDVERLSKEFSNFPNVVVAKDYKYMCSDPGQDLIVKDIQEHKLNRVVVAACSPRMHEITFQNALKKAGLNAFLFEMSNIREQCSWVHTDKELATDKARALIKAAISRVIHHEPLEKRTVEINPATLIIGGGVAGITAALQLAEAGKKVFLVEKTGMLGGNVARLHTTYPHQYPAAILLNTLVNKVEANKNIQVFKDSMVVENSGYIGNFKSKISTKGKTTEIEVGNVIVATGLTAFNPSKLSRFGYGRNPDVITSVEFETMAKSGKITTKAGAVPKTVAIVNCVGSRDQDSHEYCSRCCCQNSLKYANQITASHPDASVYLIHSDMRSFGKGCEEFYELASKNGTIFALFDIKTPPVVKATGARPVVELKEKMSGENLEIAADLVVLSVGMEANTDSHDIAKLVSISVDKNGFFIEKHPKLDPVATTTDGIYIAGCCHGPKDITDSVIQASAASARILATVAKGKVEIAAITSSVTEELCAGCQTCIKVCPYLAISFDEVKKVSVVNEALCKGCGTCTSACPSGAIGSKHFMRVQIISQIEGLLAFEKQSKLDGNNKREVI
ncbi:MAG: hypothetical protein A2583_06185 [Bdellovibrionales bacterium RIFOXYD1_FULL_53_11]|nr:MAG: hypothetical protein A2583_06185 [Bdellovibrionales bacterium RIFOXYD1_FULL_53_11]